MERHETGVVVGASEILATEAVFLSAWPNLFDADEEFEEFAEDETGERVVLDASRAPIIAPLLGTIDDEYDTISFIVIGATPAEVMDQLLTVPEYVAEDPGYLTSELAQIDANLLAVAFPSDRGDVVEIRLPLQAMRLEEAQRILATQNAKGLSAEIHYVQDIDDAQELFHIQKLHANGTLAAPETLRLLFE